MIPTASLLELAKGISGLSRAYRFIFRRKVLVLEDDPNDVYKIKRILSECGYRCRVFATGSEALVALDDEKFHCAYADLNLPGMNGVEFARRAWDRQPHLRIIFTSGCAPAMEMLPKGEAVAFIVKDVTKQSIEQTLRNGDPTPSDVALFWLLMFGAFSIGKGWLGHWMNLFWQLGP